MLIPHFPFSHIPMNDAWFYPVLFADTPCHFFDYRRRAMPAARTAEPYGQIRLSFIPVFRDKKVEQRLGPFKKFPRSGCFENVIAHFFFGALMFLKRWNEIRVRHKPHIQQKIDILWDAELKAEGYEVNGHLRCR